MGVSEHLQRPAAAGPVPRPPQARGAGAGLSGRGRITPGTFLGLQRAAGNQAVGHLLASVKGAETDGSIGASPEVLEAGEESTLTQPVDFDMDGDGEPEPHTLLLDPHSGQVLIHSDPDTLEAFFAKYGPKLQTAPDRQLLKEILDAAQLLHTARYGTKYTNTKGYTKTKAPTASQRAQISAMLNYISLKMRALSNRKTRPPSHLSLLTLRNIGGDDFCEKVVMEPLSILPRDDGVMGSPPGQETQLWRRLTNIAFYKRGHMLNEHLHGPGVNTNLVPISTAFNAVMREGVEKATKIAVNSQNKVVRFEAEALDWGMFPGAFGFPDEQELPARFHFTVNRLRKALGTSGTDIGHWSVPGPLIYEATLVHDVPTDVVAGVVRPVVRVFQPGLYFYPFGAIRPTSTPGKVQIRGSFNINNLFSIPHYGALGIDDPATLRYGRIDEPVLSEYVAPPGYGIKTLPPTTVEYPYIDQIATYTTPDRCFVVYNIAKETSLKQAHQNELAIFREKQRLLAQAALDRHNAEQLRQLRAREEREQHERERIANREREQQRQTNNSNFRYSLLAHIRTEMAPEREELGEAFKEKRETVLYFANARWKLDDHLSDRSMDDLLAPVREELRLAAASMRAENEAKEALVDELTGAFDDMVLGVLDQQVAVENRDFFRGEAAGLLQRYEEQWDRLSSGQLRAQGKEVLLSKVPHQLASLLAGLPERAEKARFVGALTKRFDDEVALLSRQFTTEPAWKEFRQHASNIFGKFEPHWQDRQLTDIRRHGVEGYWKVVQAKLSEFYTAAKLNDHA